MKLSTLIRVCRDVHIDGEGDYDRVKDKLIAYRSTLPDNEKFAVKNNVVWAVINGLADEAKSGCEVDLTA